jgi:hypothetical protein
MRSCADVVGQLPKAWGRVVHDAGLTIGQPVKSTFVVTTPFSLSHGRSEDRT